MDLDDVETGSVIFGSIVDAEEGCSLNSEFYPSLDTSHPTSDDDDDEAAGAISNPNSAATTDKGGDRDAHPELASFTCHPTRLSLPFSRVIMKSWVLTT